MISSASLDIRRRLRTVYLVGEKWGGREALCAIIRKFISDRPQHHSDTIFISFGKYPAPQSLKLESPFLVYFSLNTRMVGDLLAGVLRDWHRETLYAKPDDWIFPSTKLKGKTPLSASIMAADKIRPAALKVGIRLEPGQRFGFHNFRRSLATFLVSRGKDVKTIQGLLRHAKITTTLDLYSQSIDPAKLEAQEDIALAITSTAVAAD